MDLYTKFSRKLLKVNTLNCAVLGSFKNEMAAMATSCAVMTAQLFLVDCDSISTKGGDTHSDFREATSVWQPPTSSLLVVSF